MKATQLFLLAPLVLGVPRVLGAAPSAAAVPEPVHLLDDEEEAKPDKREGEGRRGMPDGPREEKLALDCRRHRSHDFQGFQVPSQVK